jgi:hypothetical protein
MGKRAHGQGSNQQADGIPPAALNGFLNRIDRKVATQPIAEQEKTRQ